MIIGISGKLGSGKTTCAEKLTTILDDGTIKNFADRLKYLASIIFKFDLKLAYENKNFYLDEWDMTVGETLQFVGQSFREQFGDNFWIKQVNIEPEKYNFIADLRYKNEAEWIKSQGGIVIRLNGDPDNIRKNSKRNKTHISEIDLDDYQNWDLVIDTDTNSITETVKHILQIL